MWRIIDLLTSSDLFHITTLINSSIILPLFIDLKSIQVICGFNLKKPHQMALQYKPLESQIGGYAFPIQETDTDSEQDTAPRTENKTRKISRETVKAVYPYPLLNKKKLQDPDPPYHDRLQGPTRTCYVAWAPVQRSRRRRFSDHHANQPKQGRLLTWTRTNTSAWRFQHLPDAAVVTSLPHVNFRAILYISMHICMYINVYFDQSTTLQNSEFRK